MGCTYHYIKKGKHRTNKPKIGLYWKKRSLSYKVTFGNSCIYHTKALSNQKDINKLFGLSFGLHHKNSARFGWRSKGDKIEILAYVYRNGKRVNEWDEPIYIDTIDTNEEYCFSLFTNNGRYTFVVETGDNKKMLGVNIMDAGELPSWGYYLNPYFGGDETAPHTMEIKICKIT